MNDKDLADVLNRGCAGVFAHFPQPVGAYLAIIAQHADLDQLVGFQGALDFGKNGRRKAVVADHDHGFERMCLGLECTSYNGCEFFHRPDSNRPLKKDSRSKTRLHSLDCSGGVHFSTAPEVRGQGGEAPLFQQPADRRRWGNLQW